MIERITTQDGVSVTTETRATGAVRLSLDHKYFDVQRADLTPEQAVEVAGALIKAARMKNVGEGAQAGRSQHAQAGYVNWLALIMILSLLGFWTACGMALHDAIEWTRTTGVL